MSFEHAAVEGTSPESSEDQPPDASLLFQPGSEPVLVNRSSWALERALVEILWRSIGRPPVKLVLWDGAGSGPSSDVAGRILIRRPEVLRQLCLHPSLAFGEAYSRGTLEVEGDLVEVLETLNRHIALRSVSHRRWGAVWRKLTWPWGRHSFRASKSAVHHHYDLGNDFYKLWLDQQLVYTCAYFERPEMTLEEAQTAKLDYVCRKMRLRSGETVVEAGFGWGALALHMARHYGVKVRAFNLSHEQTTYARERAKAEGLHDRIEFIEDDYRHMNGSFDAFVSVGMLEHVGSENYRELGRLLDRVLTPTGRGLIHSIGRNVPAPLDPWTEKYIFPGAYPPGLLEMLSVFPDAGFSVMDVENLRLHYAVTCREWLTRFEVASKSVAATFDEHFVRLWRLYLAASTAAFLSGDLQLFQVVFVRATSNQFPMTRADWYANESR